MSIFDPDAPFDRLPWLQEKALRALQEAARLADLAAEPDTSAWYAKELRVRAAALAGRLAPVCALLYGAGQEAAKYDEWKGIVESGSFGLAGWCKRWDIADPAMIGRASLVEEREQDEVEAKNAELPAGLPSADDSEGLSLRVQIYSGMALRLLSTDMPEPARRIILWLLARLEYSDLADVTVLSRRFLPGEIGCQADDTEEAYRWLYEQGFVERVDAATTEKPDRLALRLVVPGINDSKHAPAYREEHFGFPGDFVGGLRTMGNFLDVPLSEAAEQALRQWGGDGDLLAELRQHLQEGLGQDRVYVEGVSLRRWSDGAGLEVRLRYPMEADDHALREEVKRLVAPWLSTPNRKFGDVFYGSQAAFRGRAGRAPIRVSSFMRSRRVKRHWNGLAALW